jgi:hypothetical protein
MCREGVWWPAYERTHKLISREEALVSVADAKGSEVEDDVGFMSIIKSEDEKIKSEGWRTPDSSWWNLEDKDEVVAFQEHDQARHDHDRKYPRNNSALILIEGTRDHFKLCNLQLIKRLCTFEK